MTSVMMSGGKVKMRGGKARVGAAGDPCCCDAWRQARDCADDSLVDIWMHVTDAATYTGASAIFSLFSFPSECYYFDFDDPTSDTPGTVFLPGDVYATYEVCEECGAAPCWNGVCDDTTAYAADFTGTWDLPGGAAPCSSVVAVGGSVSAAPVTLNIYPAVGACYFSKDDPFGGPPVPYYVDTTTPGQVLDINLNRFIILTIGFDPLSEHCFIWVITAQVDGAGTYFRWYGPRNANAAGTYTLDTTFADPCFTSRIPATITVT